MAALSPYRATPASRRIALRINRYCGVCVVKAKANDPYVERVARVIAARKRKMPVNHPTIDKVWMSYAGQARNAMNETRAIYNEFGFGLPKVCAIERRTGRAAKAIEAGTDETGTGSARESAARKGLPDVESHPQNPQTEACK